MICRKSVVLRFVMPWIGVGLVTIGLSASAGIVEIADAPFPMPAIITPDFAAHDFSIVAFGAKPDGTKCEGDELLPPSGIRVRNVKVGRVAEKLKEIVNCSDVQIDGLGR